MLPALLTDTVTPDLDRALHYAALWGVEAVELRTVGGPGDRVPFVNERKLRRRLEEAEFEVAAIVPGLFEGPVGERGARLNEIASLGETLSFCTRLGCSLVVASAFAVEDFSLDEAVALLRRAGDMAGRQGTTLALLNEAEAAHPTGVRLAELLLAADHPHVLAAWSPAAAMQAGEDPKKGLEALAGLVALVRYRDGQGVGGAFTDAEPGEGAVDWPGQFATLASHGFSGPVSLEVHVPPKPKTGLRAATRLIQSLRSARA